MKPTVPLSEAPYWHSPRNWEEVKDLARKALEPRVRVDGVSLGGERASLFTDLAAVTQFVGSGLLYKHYGTKARKANDRHPPLADSPKVKLQDPLLLVPGWSTEPEKFDDLVAHLLSSKQNGERAVYLKDGQAFTDRRCTETTEVATADKVFVAVFDTNVDAPDISAPQLAQAVGTVKGSDGERKVDVVGYSMGGLATRKMLDDGSVKVDQVALLGTASRGTRFAALAEYIIKRDIKWAMSLGGLSVADLPAMGWLKTLDPNKPESNPRLDGLNKTLDRQMGNANEFLSIGSQDIGTLTKSWGGFSGGDGLVPKASTALDGLPHTLLPGKGNKHHGNLPHDKDVFDTLTAYFGWEKV